MRKENPKAGGSPVIVATFADNEHVRMTVWSAGGKPDLQRGIRLAIAAYESRRKCKPPPIVEAHFERDGMTIATFTADEIARVTP